jgi:hypothetical protein
LLSRDLQLAHKLLKTKHAFSLQLNKERRPMKIHPWNGMQTNGKNNLTQYKAQ